MQLAKKIKSKIKNVDLIYSANTLSHINDLNSVFKSITYVLSDDGILIIEDPSLLECLQKVSYDQFYNEHIYVFSLLSINNLIKKYKLEVFNIEKLNTHGGSLRYYIKRISNNKLRINKTYFRYTFSGRFFINHFMKVNSTINIPPPKDIVTFLFPLK